MGKVKQLWQDERDKRWLEHYNDYMDAIGEDERGICTVDAANRYADEMMEAEDNAKESNDAS